MRVQRDSLTYLDMRLDLRPQLLQMLHNRTVNCTPQVRVLIGNSACLVTDAIEDILRSKHKQKLPRTDEDARPTWRPPSPRNWFPARNGTWMTAPSFVISRATLFSMSAIPSKYAMSCLTTAFHAVKRSMRMSEGRRSCGAMFFWMSDWLREMVEPCLLALLAGREMEAARDMDTVSFMVGWKGKRGAEECDGGYISVFEDFDGRSNAR